MTVQIIDLELLKQLREGDYYITLHDPDGREIGTFTKNPYHPLPHSGETPYTDEERAEWLKHRSEHNSRNTVLELQEKFGKS